MARNNKRAANVGGQPDKPSSVPGDKLSKSEARQQAAQLAREQARQRRRRTVLWQIVAGVTVVAVVLVVTIVVLSRRDASTTASGSSAAPAGVTADGAFTVGDPDAPVTIQLVEDFQCPICQRFEAAAGDLLGQYAAGSDVKIEYRGIAILDRMSSTDYSSRALNASACVMGAGEEVWQKFHQELYLQQPAEGGDGLPDSDLIDIAVTAGADEDTVTSCVEDSTYAGWVDSTTSAAGDDGVTGTPTVFVNGEKLAGATPETIQAAVAKALGT